ncbi:MAG: carboxypeptidase-like regulatory domain-containing protein [Terriglobia bacterium]
MLAAFGSCFAAKKPAPVVTKTISGAVLDQSNNGVPGASVMLMDLETHKGDAMYTGANGVYAFSGLNPNDDYRLQAKYRGRVSNVREVSSLDSRTEIAINLVLNSGNAHASQ